MTKSEIIVLIANIPFILLLLIGCTDKKIEITSVYIINENWDEQARAIKINKMKLKTDSVIDFAHLNQVDIVSKLREDSSFLFYANVKIEQGDSYENKKIYFNQENKQFTGGDFCLQENMTNKKGIILIPDPRDP